MAAMKIDPDWLEDGKDKATCPVCLMVMQVPTSACAEGHALCRNCYDTELSVRKRCPICMAPTNLSRLQRCRGLEDFIGDLRMRCKHGKEQEDEEGGAGGAEKAGLAAGLDEHRRGHAGGGSRGWCNWRGKVHEFAAHLAVCGRKEVECPCPGCEERMARVDVEEHVKASGAVHLRSACSWAAEMEETVVGLDDKLAEQGRKIAALEARVIGQEMTIACQNRVIDTLQNKVIASLQRKVHALTRVFTWSTDSTLSSQRSLSYTFTDGVSGFGHNGKADNNFTHWMGFELEDGPRGCTMHFKCMILDKDDKVLRTVSDSEDSDFQKPPQPTVSPIGGGMGSIFNLSPADRMSAVRADGSIKLRMAVHLYLPE